MMPRLTFARRIGLIVGLGVGMAWLMILALYYISRAPGGGVTPPAPGQIAALVGLLERTPAAERPQVLQAVSTEIFRARIGVDTPASPQQAWRYRQFKLDPYLAVLDGRPISVNFVDRQTRRLLARLFFPIPELHIVLRTQDVLVVDLQGELLLGPLGLPVGFGAGVLGTLIAFIALVVMHREAKPLAGLARAVDGVDLSINPVLLPEAKRSAPEIRALIAAFNRLQGRLAELLRARMAMLGGISHDVRTFATRLRLRVDKISDEAERERAIADINDMIHLLDDALLASRAGAGELAEAMIEIDDVIRTEIADRQPSGARIDYQAGQWKRPPIVLGDRLALKRIVANLTDNAIKYGGVAHLKSLVEGRSMVIIVDDEGPGIPRDKREAMLEPFSRLETSRNRGTGGAGLGLAIVRALTEAHGGTLSIDDAPLRGARITVRLPLFQAN